MLYYKWISYRAGAITENLMLGSRKEFNFSYLILELLLKEKSIRILNEKIQKN
jgi:hypothetical protein